MGCRCSRRKDELIRIIRTPEGGIALDATGRLNGRGAYLCRDNRDCLTTAVRRKALEKALNAEIPDSVGEALLKAYDEMAVSG